MKDGNYPIPSLSFIFTRRLSMKKATDLTIQKTYFRRPLWTSDNSRFWAILLTVSVVTVATLVLTGKWFSGISREIVVSQIKRGYAAFLMENAGNKEEQPAASGSPISPPDIKPSGQYIPVATHRPGQSGNEHSGTVSEDFGRGVIAAAVESVPGYPAIEYLPSRQERPLTYHSTVEIYRSHDNQIQIPVPPTIRFASLNGNRDLQETTAIMEMNEIDIKYCFERIWRYDPSFTGSLLLSFTIHPDGYVIPETIKILNSNIPDPRVLECIRRSIRRWRNFSPIAFEDGHFTVTRKYVF